MSIHVRTRLACLVGLLLTLLLVALAVYGSIETRRSNFESAAALDAIRHQEASDDIVKRLRADIGDATRAAEHGAAIAPATWAMLDGRLETLGAADHDAATNRFVQSGRTLVAAASRGSITPALIGDFAASLRQLESSRDVLRHSLSDQAESYGRRSSQVTGLWSMATVIAVLFAAAVHLGFALWLGRNVLAPLGRIAGVLARGESGETPRSDDLARSDEIGTLARASVVCRQAADERSAAAERLMYAARHDALTGVMGRQTFDEMLAAEFATLTEQDELALFTLDLDRFKDINDSNGHAGGDAVLKRVAAILQKLCGPESVGRLGGDEFAVVQRGLTQPAAAGTLAARLLAAFSEAEISVSIGVALYPKDATDETRLRHYSDLALYRAKHEGRGRARFFGSLRGRATGVEGAYVPLPSELGAAIAAGELRLHYQPKMRARSGLVDGVEALVRWQHPVRGLVAPDVFIPVAEKMGQIRSLTQWTLERAVADQKILAEGGQSVPVYINISACLLGDPGFARTALSILATRVGQMGLEITETGIIEDPRNALANLQEFVDAGLRIAIDDYGAGMSSLSYLKKLPAHELKIDRTFVAELSRSHRDPLIVRSTIDLAHALGLEVTAEGVEKLSSYALLRAMGCDLIQGFLIARPMPLDGLIGFLADGEALAHLGDGEFDARAAQSW